MRHTMSMKKRAIAFLLCFLLSINTMITAIPAVTSHSFAETGGESETPVVENAEVTLTEEPSESTEDTTPLNPDDAHDDVQEEPMGSQETTDIQEESPSEEIILNSNNLADPVKEEVDEATNSDSETVVVKDFENNSSETQEESVPEETEPEESPKEDTPVEEVPKEETPVEEAPKEETPVEEVPREDTPVEEVPKEDTFAEEPTLEKDTEKDPAEKPEKDTAVEEEEESKKELANEGLKGGGDPSLSMQIKNSAGQLLDLNNWNMAKNENIIVEGAFQAPLNTTTPLSAIVTLPDYYVFDGPTGGTNYSISDVTPRSLKITFPAPSSPANPPTIGFSFKAKLDRNSITPELYTKWQNNTWNPNAGNCTFTFKMEDGSGTPVLSTANIVVSKYNGVTFTIRNYTIDAHNFQYEQFCNLRYTKPDFYDFGPVDVNHIKLEAPEGFYFPKGIDYSWGTTTLSADKRTMDIAIHDLLTSGTRNTGSIIIWPDPQYVNGNNQDPNGRFAPGARYTFKSTASFAGPFLEDMEKSATTVVRNYTLGETGTISAKGIPDVTDGNKLVIKEVSSGEMNVLIEDALSVVDRRSTQNYEVEPLNDGADYSSEVKFDPEIMVTQFRFTFLMTRSVYGQPLDRVRVKSLVYYTKNNPTTPVSVTIPANSQNNYVEYKLPAGEAVDRIVITYDKLVYPYIPISTLFRVYFDAPTGNPGEKFPINYTLKDASGEKISEAINYVMIKDEECPVFTFVNHRDTSMNATNEPGVYTKEGVAGYMTVGIRNPKVGGDSGVKSSISNPSLRVNAGGRNETRNASQMSPLYWSGKVQFNPVMGDGKWTIEVMTTTHENVYNSRPNNGTFETKTFAIPAFTEETTIDLYSSEQFGDRALSSDEIIGGTVTFKHDGVFDYSVLSGASDKKFFNIYYKNIPKLVHQGMYWARAGNGNGDGYNLGYVYFHARYDDCSHIDKRHQHGSTLQLGGINFQDLATIKGSDVIVPAMMNTTYEGTLKQGGTTVVTAKITMDAYKSLHAQLWSQGNETAYFKLSDQPYVTPIQGSGVFDGVSDPDSSIVEIGGVRYFRVKNLRGTPVQKQQTGTQNPFTYEPWVVSFKVYSLPTTPVTSGIQVFEDVGSWLDLADGDEYNHTVNGATVHTAIQPWYFHNSSALQWIYGGRTVSNVLVEALVPGHISDTLVQSWDDPLNLYTATASYDRNFALRIRGFKSAAELDSIQGITLNPGVWNNYSEDTQEVHPNEEGQMTTGISIIAGNSDMQGLTSTIKIPRAGDELTMHPGNISTVSQFLRGPVVSLLKPSSPQSKPIVITYSLDGTTFLSQADFEGAGHNWNDVTHIRITNELLKGNDTAMMYLPLTTQNAIDDEGGSNGVSYWEAVFKTSSLDAKSNRMNTYNYIPFIVSGTVWLDTNKDGYMDDSESKLKDATVKMYENYGTPQEKLLETVKTDDLGNYSLKARRLKNLTVIVDAGYEWMVTKFAGDNDFKEDPISLLPKADISAVNSDITGLDAGLVKAPIVHSTVAHLKGTKTLKDSTLKDRQFSFVLKEDPENQNGVTINSSTGSHNADGELTFPDKAITFARPGVFTFIMEEVGTPAAGYTFDSTPVKVTFTVERNADHTELTITSVTYEKDNKAIDKPEFNNTYTVPEPIEIAISGTKTLTGGGKTNADITAGLFSFTVTADTANPANGVNGVPGEKVDVQAGGALDFGTWNFSKAGTYKFTVSENDPPAGYTKAPDVTVEVVVTLNELTNAFERTVAYSSGDTLSFANTYTAPEPIEVPISGTKTLTGGGKTDADITAGFFSFNVTADNENPADGVSDLPVGTVYVLEGGALDFGTWSFSKVGTYKFTVSENDPPAGYTQAPDVTVTVVITLDTTTNTLKNKVTYSSGGTLSFANTYTAPEPLEMAINGTKTLTGGEKTNADITAGLFSFNVTADAANPGDGVSGVPSEKVDVQDGGALDFGTWSFSKAGTYNFTISENDPPAGYTKVSDVDVEVEVVVTLNELTNVFERTITYSSGDTLSFANIYTAPEPIEVPISGTKTLSGGEKTNADITAGLFSFNVTADDENPTEGVSGLPTLKVYVQEGGALDFGTWKFSKVGTYKFTISENEPPVGYSKGEDVMVTVVITLDTTTNTLKNEVTYTSGDTLTFANVYAYPESMMFPMKGTKTLSGGGETNDDITAGLFSFNVTADEANPSGGVSGLPSEKVDVQEGGALDFGTWNFSKVGTYKFTVSENDPPAGYTKAPDVTVEVVVTLNELTNAFERTVTYSSGDTLSFANTYTAPEPIEVPISGTKTLTGDGKTNADITAGLFSFNVTADVENPVDGVSGVPSEKIDVQEGGALDFGTWSFSKVGTYKFTVSENKPPLGYSTAGNEDITVVITLEKSTNKLKSEVTYSTGKDLIIDNVYGTPAPIDVVITGKKTLSGGGKTNTDITEGLFSFNVTADKDNPTDGVSGLPAGKVDVKSGGALDFGTWSFSKAGTYKFTITENQPPAGYTKASHVTVEVVITLNKVTNNFEKSVAYSTGDTLVIENTYRAPEAVEVVVTGTKTLSGDGKTNKDIGPSMFTFVVTPDPANPATVTGVPGQISVAAGGGLDLGTWKFTKEGTYKFILSENEPPAGYTKASDVTIEVVVTLNEATNTYEKAVTYSTGDALVINNTYTKPEGVAALLKGRKVLEGQKVTKEIEGGMFTLEMKQDAGNDTSAVNGARETIPVGPQGVVDFGEIFFSKPGTYQFTVKEINTKEKGYTYDTSVYQWNVEVKLNSSTNKLEISQRLTKDSKPVDEVVFTNYYAPAPVTSDPPVKKVVEGKPKTDSAFVFIMKAEKADNPMPKGSKDGVLEATVVGEGEVEFGILEFTEVGTYVYTVSEKDAGVSSYSYDKSVFTITYEVTDNKGQLEVVRTFSKDGREVKEAVFTNVYKGEEEVKKPDLPSTGGKSAGLILLIGVVFLALGILLLRKKKKSE